MAFSFLIAGRRRRSARYFTGFLDMMACTYFERRYISMAITPLYGIMRQKNARTDSDAVYAWPRDFSPLALSS